MRCYQEYKSLPPIPLKRKAYINAIYYWKGYNRSQSGLYLKTNLGRIYFSTFHKMWRSSEVDLSSVDIDKLERDVFLKTGIGSEKELGTMTEKKFKQLKESSIGRCACI